MAGDVFQNKQVGGIPREQPMGDANPPNQHNHGLEAMRLETSALLENAMFTKSESSKEILTVMLRLIETLQHGEPKTQRRPRHHA